MDILAGLRQLLGIKEEPELRKTLPARSMQTPLPAKAMIEDGQPGGYDIPEQPFINDFGSTVVPSRGITIPTQSRGIAGATNINEQISRGYTPYSPGEGPQTIFDQFLRRR